MTYLTNITVGDQRVTYILNGDTRQRAIREGAFAFMDAAGSEQSWNMATFLARTILDGERLAAGPVTSAAARAIATVVIKDGKVSA